MKTQHQVTQYVIRSLSEGDEELDGAAGAFWSNEDGWGSLQTATFFSTSERMSFKLPMSAAMDAEWMLLEEANDLAVTTEQPSAKLEMLNITVHDFTGKSSREAYDQTQCLCKDGDIINLGNGNVAIMVQAWPTVVVGEIETFHRLESGQTFESLDDGKYAASAAKARQIGDPLQRFEYQLLGRLQQDCEYFLGAGNGNRKHLWAQDESLQILKMKELYEGLPVKPEWITLEAIEGYAANMAVARASMAIGSQRG